MKVVAFAIFRKEILEALRDKRSLFLVFFVPLFFYPCVLGVSMLSQPAALHDQDEQVFAEWVNLPDESQVKKPDVDGLQWVEDSTEDLNLVQVLGTDKGYSLTYEDTLFGELQKDIVLQKLSAHKDQQVEENLIAAGVPVNLLTPFEIEVIQPDASKSGIGKYGVMVAYFLMFLAFTGCMSVAVDTAAGERERGTMEAMLSTPASFAGIGLGKLSFIFVTGMASFLATLIGMLSAMVFYGAKLGTVLETDWLIYFQIACLMGGAIFLFSSLLYGISITAMSAREAHLRSSLFMLVLVVVLIVAGNPTVVSSAWVNYVPLLNVAVAISNSLTGGLSSGVILINFVISVITGLFIIAWVGRILKRKPDVFLVS